MKRTVPAKELISCDVCKIETEKNDRQFIRNGGLVIKMDALDFQGQPVADGSMKYDLCEKCLTRISKAINAEADKIRLDLIEEVTTGKGI